jgi:hypothetical protein
VAVAVAVAVAVDVAVAVAVAVADFDKFFYENICFTVCTIVICYPTQSKPHKPKTF